MSALVPSSENPGFVHTGRARTSGGKSHSCERPTWNCPRSSACTISVAEAISETIRILFLLYLCQQQRAVRGDTDYVVIPAACVTSGRVKIRPWMSVDQMLNLLRRARSDAGGHGVYAIEAPLAQAVSKLLGIEMVKLIRIHSDAQLTKKRRIAPDNALRIEEAIADFWQIESGAVELVIGVDEDQFIGTMTSRVAPQQRSGGQRPALGIVKAPDRRRGVELQHQDGCEHRRLPARPIACRNERQRNDHHHRVGKISPLVGANDSRDHQQPAPGQERGWIALKHLADQNRRRNQRRDTEKWVRQEDAANVKEPDRIASALHRRVHAELEYLVVNIFGPKPFLVHHDLVDMPGRGEKRHRQHHLHNSFHGWSLGADKSEEHQNEKRNQTGQALGQNRTGTKHGKAPERR